jgi:hypothetical protein
MDTPNKPINNEKLNPYFVTGFVDGEKKDLVV